MDIAQLLQTVTRTPLTRRRLLIGVGAGFLLPAAALLRWLWPHEPDAGKLRVTAIDVGQGDSTLIVTPSGRTILVDGGGTSDEAQAADTDIGERVVVPFLRYGGIGRIDVLVLTHPHGDHVGGLSAVVRALDIGIALDGTTLPYPSPAYQQFCQELTRRGVPRHRAVRGMTLDMGDGVSLQALNPPANALYGSAAVYGTNADNATINNYSVGLRLVYGQTRFILTGDAQTDAEAQMCLAPDDLHADVLKCGHHGSRNASSDDWLARVRPRQAVISCGRHNRFGHPHPETLARLAAHNVQVFRTDHHGAVTFVSDGRTVTARTFLKSK